MADLLRYDFTHGQSDSLGVSTALLAEFEDHRPLRLVYRKARIFQTN